MLGNILAAAPRTAAGAAVCTVLSFDKTITKTTNGKGKGKKKKKIHIKMPHVTALLPELALKWSC